jgi:hypothetical protein
MTEPPDSDRLFRSVARSAAHLEMRDDYGGSSPAFAAWREHRRYDRSGPDAAWHELVGSVIRRGAAVRRADHQRARQRLRQVRVQRDSGREPGGRGTGALATSADGIGPRTAWQ